MKAALSTTLALSLLAGLAFEGSSLGALALVGWVSLVHVASALVSGGGSVWLQLAVALPVFAVSGVLDVQAGGGAQATSLRVASACVAVLGLGLALERARERGREGVLGGVATLFVVLAPALDVALELGGVRGPRAPWFEACVAAGPLGFAWTTMALDAPVSLSGALASLAAPALVFVAAQLLPQREATA